MKKGRATLVFLLFALALPFLACRPMEVRKEGGRIIFDQGCVAYDCAPGEIFHNGEQFCIDGKYRVCDPNWPR